MAGHLRVKSKNNQQQGVDLKGRENEEELEEVKQ